MQPQFIYGTAWKKDDTTRCTAQALAAGFRAIDTANQAKHYQEVLVGTAIKAAMDQGLKRQDLFLQSKFTSIDGQDHRLPYDPKADLATQVQQSFASSLEHLHTDYLDSLLLHGPHSHPGLIDEDWQVWRAMEKLVSTGQVKKIGVSNVNLAQLQGFMKDATVKPSIVQNRCYAVRGWDEAVRQYCVAQGLMYQGFSLLTANVQVLRHPALLAIAERCRATPAQVIFRFSMDVGMTPLTGTSSVEHLQEDLAAVDVRLEPQDVQMIQRLGEKVPPTFSGYL